MGPNGEEKSWCIVTVRHCNTSLPSHSASLIAPHDFFGFALTEHLANTNLDRIQAAGKYLGMPFEPSKTQRATQEPEILGIAWNLREKTASPKKRKLAEMERFAVRARNKKKFKVKEIERIHGQLCYCGR